LLYIRDDFKVVDNSTILQVRFSIFLGKCKLNSTRFFPLSLEQLVLNPFLMLLTCYLTKRSSMLGKRRSIDTNPV
jgi:hypothetical protein